MTDDDVADIVEAQLTEPSIVGILADAQTFKRQKDPSTPHYPRGLVLDLAMRTAPVADILSAYRIPEEEFRKLAEHPLFRQELREMRDKLKEEGFSFKVKAQAQAEAYLAQAWNMVHDAETPANVRAQLIQWTTKVAGLETSQPSTSMAQDLTKLTDEIRSMPAQDLEIRALQIIMRKSEPRVVSKS